MQFWKHVWKYFAVAVHFNLAGCFAFGVFPSYFCFVAFDSPDPLIEEIYRWTNRAKDPVLVKHLQQLNKLHYFPLCCFDDVGKKNGKIELATSRILIRMYLKTSA